mmetsp:Transcript_31180/g.85461  ORF Transcript_31180/g.85461 Transcript_31180/m.85461 type:complete len:218 (+) Transcript_31180:1510-2163(+)
MSTGSYRASTSPVSAGRPSPKSTRSAPSRARSIPGRTWSGSGSLSRQPSATHWTGSSSRSVSTRGRSRPSTGERSKRRKLRTPLRRKPPQPAPQTKSFRRLREAAETAAATPGPRTAALPQARRETHPQTPRRRTRTTTSPRRSPCAYCKETSTPSWRSRMDCARAMAQTVAATPLWPGLRAQGRAPLLRGKRRFPPPPIRRLRWPLPRSAGTPLRE